MRGMHAANRVRLAHRRDKPEAGIIYRLRLKGWAVFPLSGTPGLPDLLCVRRGEVRILEVKDVHTPVTPAQVRMHRALRLAGLTVPIVSTPEEALAVLEGATPRTIEGMRVSRAKRGRYKREELPPRVEAAARAMAARVLGGKP